MNRSVHYAVYLFLPFHAGRHIRICVCVCVCDQPPMYLLPPSQRVATPSVSAHERVRTEFPCYITIGNTGYCCTASSDIGHTLRHTDVRFNITVR